MGPDGILRSLDAQKQLNASMAATFATPAGQEVLAYLKSITINAVCGPEITDTALRHREGMRHLVAIIQHRIEAHHIDQQRSTPVGPGDNARPARLRPIGRARP